jgi:hypothetical protein
MLRQKVAKIIQSKHAIGKWHKEGGVLPWNYILAGHLNNWQMS